jgi:hypothetical protein
MKLERFRELAANKRRVRICQVDMVELFEDICARKEKQGVKLCKELAPPDHVPEIEILITDDVKPGTLG